MGSGRATSDTEAGPLPRPFDDAAPAAVCQRVEDPVDGLVLVKHRLDHRAEPVQWSSVYLSVLIRLSLASFR